MRVFILLFLFLSIWVRAQQKQGKIQHIHSDKIEQFRDKYPGQILLSGSVRMEHNGAILEADSILFDEKNNYAKACSNVHMISSANDLTADQVDYDANLQLAVAEGNVVLRDAEQTLYTDQLNYDRKLNKAYYTTGGTIASNESIINSRSGEYDINKQINSFDSDIVINNKDYLITSKSLKHYSKGKYVEFFDETFIQSKNNPTRFIKTSKGTYYLDEKKAYLENNSSVHSDGKMLQADKLFYNQLTGFGKGEGNVFLNDPNEKRFIKGDYGEAFKELDSAFVTGNALAVRAFEEDSLYLHSDTLMVSKSDSLSLIRAFHQAKFFKTNMQGKADSIVLSESQGKLSFFSDPVIWSGLHQITGDTIHVFINTAQEKLDSIQVRSNAFAISKRDSLSKEEFHQVKSRQMLAIIINEQLDWVQADGNAQSLIYLEEEKKDTLTQALEKNLVGINRSDCATIEAKFKKSDIQIISCLGGANSKIVPPHKFSEIELFLPKFIWREKERFKSWQEIMPTQLKLND